MAGDPDPESFEVLIFYQVIESLFPSPGFRFCPCSGQMSTQAALSDPAQPGKVCSQIPLFVDEITCRSEVHHTEVVRTKEIARICSCRSIFSSIYR
jgi:hypothetical protein